MRIILSLLLLNALIFAKVYYAKIQPNQTYDITSQVAGKIIAIKSDLESKLVKKAQIIQIDDDFDKKELTIAKQKFLNLEQIFAIKTKNYRKIEDIKSKSLIEKNNARIDLLNTQNGMLSSKLALMALEDRIAKKKIFVKNLYINEFFVKYGAFVGVGTKLVEVMDFSKSKLYIYLSLDDLKGIEQKPIKIDGKTSQFKVNKVFQVTDDVFISKYKVELIGPGGLEYDKLVKVEI